MTGKEFRKKIRNKLKIKEMLKGIFCRHPKIQNPKLAMTLLVKNEVDVIEKNIIFHKSMGVDVIIVTDNNSTDGTREVLEKLYSKGYIDEIIDEPLSDYQQIEWVDRMIIISKEKYNADWVMNVDADEFWFSKRGNYKKTLSETTKNVLKCKSYAVLPEDENLFFNNIKLIVNFEKCLGYNLSKWSIYSDQVGKVFHRTNGYKKIHMGNHGVDIRKKNNDWSKDVIIHHYSIRSRKQYKHKMLTGGQAVEKNMKLGKHIAEHWRYFYEGFKNRTIDLDEEYKRVIGSEYIDEFEKMGVYEESTAIRDFFLNKE